MKCFYHNDADGMCAGYWVYVAASHTVTQGEKIEMIEINYGMKFPFETIQPHEEIYIVDYSIKPDEMRKLLSITAYVTWIDHHKTAIEAYADFEDDIRGVRYDGVAGCMLTYCYLYEMTKLGFGEIKPFDVSMTEDAPMYVKLIADWDTWTFKYGDDTRYFGIAFYANDFSLSPVSDMWHRMMFGGSENFLIADGKLMAKYRDSWAKSYMKLGCEVEFHGFKCFALNLGRCNSEYFKSLTTEYDILMPYVFDGEMFHVSMYSKKADVDVSVIAKQYGGGGHFHASGFEYYKLPFKKKV